MAASSSEETLIEVREFEMVSPCGGKPTRRVAHFLKPSLLISQQPTQNSQTLFNNFKPTKPISPSSKSLSSKIHFHGWRCPQKKWNSWVEKLRPSFEPVWKKSSIFEPIILKIARSKHKKTSHSSWMDVWMEIGSEFELEAFLSLWLSRYVLPADSYGTINKNVFPIAVLLARGTKIALAPAVLASIYRDLRLLKAYIETFGDHNHGNVAKLKLRAPLQLLQVWVWERFPTLSPEPKAITDGLPRLARWNKAKIVREVDVGLAIDSAKGSFRWRPYSTRLNNWSCCAKLYPQAPKWVLVGSESDLDLQSYARCIRVSELVGLDSFQQYLPHRVAMQFGFDQDIPLDVPRRNDTHEIAWSYYNRPIRDVKLYMPSRLFESDVTTHYFHWWKSNFKKQTMSCVMMEDVMPTVDHFQCSLKGSFGLAERIRIKIENNEANVPPGFEYFDPKIKREVVSTSCDHPASKRFKGSPNAEIGLESNKANTSSCSPSPQVKGVDSGDDSDTDHLPLSQLYKHKYAKRLNTPDTSGAIPPSHSESPLCSGEDNVSIRDSKSATPPCSMSSNEKELRRCLKSIQQSAEVDFEAQVSQPKATELDLEARISRLQRIVDYFLPCMQNAKN
ncbi:hypothetical protein Cgig2_004618 [Carnegiea gigantea]|uniref:Aminotransferase-like plant mobile domain-containing protein n=1 Tax=Carnegiea gigantea TaxID=171969 RepID=A0A9Q1JZV1_9CARY|nr:hypothetical protein Cgig2_004618 [Carnegiea gigantea]